MIKEETYIAPKVDVIDLFTEAPIASSPFLAMITMTGSDLRDPISITSDEYTSIFE